MAVPQVGYNTDVYSWVTVINQVGTGLGDASLLPTPSTTVVAGLNVLETEVGTITNLMTTDKSSLVNALNEVYRLSFVMGVVLGNPLV